MQVCARPVFTRGKNATSMRQPVLTVPPPPSARLMRIARALARLWLILPRRLRLRAARDQPIWACLRYGSFALCLRQKAFLFQLSTYVYTPFTKRLPPLTGNKSSHSVSSPERQREYGERVCVKRILWF